MSTASGIAILGAGIFAKEAHLPALGLLGEPAPVLRAVYSRSEKSARDFVDAVKATLQLESPPEVYHDADPSANLDALLARKDIKSVIVILPITLQPSIILKALAAGKHVLSEKPVAPDVAQGLELIKTYNKIYKPKGLIWRVAENFEAERAVLAAADAIRAGKIGRVVFFRGAAINYINKDSKYYKTPWRTVPDYQGGFLLDGGVHTIAVLRRILPNRLTHLSGFASLNKDYLKPHDTLQAVVKADNHFHGIVELTWAHPTPTHPQSDPVVVTGTDGWLSFNYSWAPKPIIRITIKSLRKAPAGGGSPESGSDGATQGEVEEVIEHPMNGVADEMAAFFDAVEGKPDVAGLNLGDPLEALRDVALIQAGLDSDGKLVGLLDLVPESLDA